MEIVSFYRTADRMPLTVAEDVKVRALGDLRPTSRHYAGTLTDQRLPGTTCPHDTVYAGPTPPSRLGEDRLAAHLRGSDAEVVLATRPYLVCFLAEHGRTDCLRIGQEYLVHEHRSAAPHGELDAAIARLDAYVTPTWEAARAHRGALPDAPVRLANIPVCSPEPDAEPSTGNSRTVLAAGRLTPMKRYDRLVDVFADVVAVHPDWSLRIYRTRPGTGAAATPCRGTRPAQQRPGHGGAYTHGARMGQGSHRRGVRQHRTVRHVPCGGHELRSAGGEHGL